MVILASRLIYNSGKVECFIVEQEHEQALADAIARLADVSDGESGKNFSNPIFILGLTFTIFVPQRFDSLGLLCNHS